MNKNILDKINKCLRLAKSSNPHEAATAMRQAQALMQKHNLSTDDVAMNDIFEKAVTSGSSNKPSQHLINLAHMIAKAFGVRIILNIRYGTNKINFIGQHQSPEIASYAFSVLRRQLTKARSAFYKTTRGKRVNRTAKADIFADGWVYEVNKRVVAFANNKQTEQVITTYMDKHYSNLNETKPKAPKKQRSTATDNAFFIGVKAGKDVTLNHGVNGQSQKQLS